MIPNFNAKSKEEREYMEEFYVFLRAKYETRLDPLQREMIIQYQAGLKRRKANAWMAKGATPKDVRMASIKVREILEKEIAENEEIH